MPKSNASCECTISQSFSLVLSRVRFRTRCLSGGSAWSWWQYPHSCARGQPVGEDRNTHGWHLRQRRCGSAGSLEPAVIAVATWVVLRGSNQGGRTFLSSSSSASVKIELLRFLRSFWQSSWLTILRVFWFSLEMLSQNNWVWTMDQGHFMSNIDMITYWK